MIRGIVVGGFALGEADRIVRLLSAERGRISGVARRARASRRRFSGVFELGNRVEVSLRKGRGELPVVQEATLLEAPRRARTDLDRLALLAYGCELCAALAPEDAAAKRLTRLLEVWLDLLERAESVGAGQRLALEAKALTFAGLAPVLVRCAICGEMLDLPVFFDPEAGGAVHGRCGGGRPVDPNALLHLEALRRTPLHDLPPEPPPGLDPWLLSDFARHHLSRDLKSRHLLEDLDPLGSTGPRG